MLGSPVKAIWMQHRFQCSDLLSPPPSLPQMQYVFIFQALLEHYLYGDTELEVTSLESHLAKLYTPSPGAGCSGLEAEFKVCFPKVALVLCGPLNRSIKQFHSSKDIFAEVYLLIFKPHDF